MSDDRWLLCPCCGWGKKYQTERQINRLDRIEPKTGPFIDHRYIGGGKGSGFPRESFETLEEVKNLSEYQELISGLREQCKKILNILGE